MASGAPAAKHADRHQTSYGLACPSCIEKGEQSTIGFSVEHGICCDRLRGFHKFSEEQVEEIRKTAEASQPITSDRIPEPETVNTLQPEAGKTEEAEAPAEIPAPIPPTVTPTAAKLPSISEEDAAARVGTWVRLADGDVVAVVRIPEWITHPIASEGENLGESFGDSLQRLVSDTLGNYFGLASRKA